jgi:hypothetical protein
MDCRVSKGIMLVYTVQRLQSVGHFEYRVISSNFKISGVTCVKTVFFCTVYVIDLRGLNRSKSL